MRTNQFPRKLNGNLEDVDLYIECQKGIKIHYFGRSVLEAYIPSIQQGRNILRLIYRDHINNSNTITNVSEFDVKRNDKVVHVVKENVSIVDETLYKKEINSNDIIFGIEESDSEVLFKFRAKSMDKLEKYFNPKTNGANISPFSSRNLPQNKTYKIPDETLSEYKDLVRNIPKKDMLLLSRYTNDFLKSFVTKKNTWENIKVDMVLKGLTGKNYIHSIGQWDKYIQYLKENL